MLAREIKKVQQGADPINVFRDPDHPIIDTKLDASVRVGRAGGFAHILPPKAS
jgi:hypothetical protein